MKDLLFFDKMVTPSILLFLYWFNIVCLVVASVIAVGTGRIFEGLISLFFGAIVLRVFYEILMMAFKNNEYLRRIAERTVSEGPVVK